MFYLKIELVQSGTLLFGHKSLLSCHEYLLSCHQTLLSCGPDWGTSALTQPSPPGEGFHVPSVLGDTHGGVAGRSAGKENASAACSLSLGERTEVKANRKLNAQR